MKYFLLFGLLLLTSVTQYLALEDNDIESVGTDDTNSKIDGAKILDPLNIDEVNELREKAEKFNFQTEVNRMMKLIINSLYRNKEIFLRELISNASDAIDKIRLLALTSKSELDTNPELNIKVKAEKENKVLHIIDTGIGMTEQDLINNLGTIAKSGTADFLSKMQDAASSDGQAFSDMIGQFGVGFYSAFLVAERVVVTTKHNNDSQYIWESDSNSFSIIKDPRGDTLKRGTVISLYLKEEALDFLDEKNIRNLIKKYSQFINFPIHLWASKVIEEEVLPDKQEDTKSTEKTEEDSEDKEAENEDDDDNVKVEDAPDEEEKPKAKKVSRTVHDWELINDSKPIWTRKPSNVTKEEYHEFYKSLTHDTSDPFSYTHFIAEGEVTFKSLLYVPKVQPSESFNRYGTKSDNIKLFVRRVFITDEFNDMMPNYLNFIRGVVDSDDLPLNVSRETLQQHKLIKIIKKKLIRKVLDMLKKINPEEYLKFWKEFSTNIKLGIMEDPTNRSRLAKLLRFQSSNSKKLTSLADYVSRAKPNQEQIYFIAGTSRDEVENSPFVEGLLSKGYEVLYLVEAVDEYTISALPEFEGKKFQNVAKEGFKLADADQAELEALKASFEPLLKWLSDVGLKGQIIRAQISERLRKSPCALVAGMFGWTGNMERLAMSNAHQKSDDPQRSYYLNQKKTLEINPKHPIIRDLLRRIEADENDESAKHTAKMLLQTATLRSGFMLQETAEFAHAVEAMMRESLGIPDSEDIDDEADLESDSDQQEQPEENEKEDVNHEEL